MPPALPTRLFDRLSGYLRLHGSSVAWMLADRGWMFVSGFVIGFWIIRHLGPSAYGEFSAALSVTAVFAGLSLMGLETVIIRLLSRSDVEPRQVLLAAAALRTIGSIAYVPLCGLASWLLFGRTSDVIWLAVIIASAAIFRATDVVGLHFQATGQYRRAALSRISVRMAGDAVRVAMILQGAPMIWFAVAVCIESIAAFAVFGLLGREMLTPVLRPDRKLAIELFRAGRPVLISGLLAAAYARMDQLVLYAIGGATENGHYAAAVRISEIFNVVVASISPVAAAHFGRIATTDAASFDAELRTYYRSMITAGFVISATLSLFATPIVQILYGDAFASNTSDVLRFHAWTVCLVWSSVALEPWFYHHRKLDSYIPKAIITLAVSAPLVYSFTKLWGPQGTAFSVVLIYATFAIATNAMLSSIRAAFKFQIQVFKA